MLTVRGYRHLRGRACLATALRDVFEHAGHTLAEHEIFGLGGGLLFEYTGVVRTRRFDVSIVAPALDAGLGANLNVRCRQRFAADPDHASGRLVELLGRGVPVALKLHPSACRGLLAEAPARIAPHLPAHWVVAAGHDADRNVIELYDNRRQEPFCLSIAELEAARHTGDPWQNPRGAWLEIAFPAELPSRRMSCWLALRQTVIAFRHVSSPLLNQGIDGLTKFARHAKMWRSILSSEQIAETAVRMIAAITVGGGLKGAYRVQYAQFVDEAASVLAAPALRRASPLFRHSGHCWSALVRELWSLSSRPDDPAPFVRGSTLHAALDALVAAESAAIDSLAMSIPAMPRSDDRDRRMA